MLYLVLSEYSIATGDYGNDITFRIYNNDMATAFDATDYTGAVVKVFDKDGRLVLSDTDVTWSAQDEGVGSFALSPTNYLYMPGRYYVEIELTKTNTRISTAKAGLTVFGSPYT